LLQLDNPISRQNAPKRMDLIMYRTLSLYIGIWRHGNKPDYVPDKRRPLGDGNVELLRLRVES
jgi:hypothetical protein